MTQPDPPAEVSALREAQAKEYGTYVAKEAIYIGNARAFNPGDAVPVSHVTDGKVSKSQVEPATTEKKG